MPHEGYLCIGCLEERLGRRLARADFTDADVNKTGPETARYAFSDRTPRLAGRLAAE